MIIKSKNGVVNMALIEWSTELSVGIESIDQQHKELMNIINRLDEAMHNDDSIEVLRKTFTDLTHYTQKHFAYEEKLFNLHDYEDGIEHKRQHDELIVQLIELKEKFDHYQKEKLTEQVMAFLKNWLTYHILETDKAYSEHLQEQGVN